MNIAIRISLVNNFCDAMTAAGYLCIQCIHDHCKNTSHFKFSDRSELLFELEKKQVLVGVLEDRG